MTSATEHEYPQPQDGEIPRFSGLPTFFRLPFAPQTSELDISVVGVPLLASMPLTLPSLFTSSILPWASNCPTMGTMYGFQGPTPSA